MKRKMIYVVAVVTLLITTPMLSMANSAETIPAPNTETEKITYEQVDKAQIPDVISETISEKFKDYSVDNFYLGSDETYKVEVSKSDEKWAIFFDSEGKFSKKEDLSVDKAETTTVE